MSMEVKAVQALLESLSGTPFPKWMKCLAIGVGLLLIVDGMRIFAFHKALVGVIVLYIAGYEKRIFLSDEGIVREVKTWVRNNRSILRWEDVKYVGLARRGSRMMAFFEEDVTGWKVLFKSGDESRLREIVERHAPDVEIGVVGEK